MALDSTSLRSRRSMLITAVGAAVAAGSAVLGRAAPVRAADGEALLLGESNAAGSDTGLTASGGTKALAVLTDVSGSTAVDASGVAFGVVGASAAGVGVAGAAGVSPDAAPPPITPSTGVYGISLDGTGVYGASNTGAGVYAATHSTTFAAVVGQGNERTGVHGHAGDVPLPPAPPATGVYGTGQTGVFGYAVQGAGSRGVLGKTTSGQAIRGEATSGVGVRGYATTTGVGGLFTAPGVALKVEGRAQFSRSGKASIPANAISVDVTVPGGLGATAMVLATMQEYYAGVSISGVRLNHPVAGVARIYLTKVASTTTSTPVAWMAVG